MLKMDVLINRLLNKKKFVQKHRTSGLYYKLIMIIIDADSVMLQIVASLTIIIDDAS
jgi:hypothetical protein